MTSDATQLALWIKLVYTMFVAVLVPIYLKHYGPANFLWFSDVALLGMVPGLWAESPLIVSTLTVAVALPEMLWNLDFFARMLTGRAPLGIATYMIDASLPRYLRGLSLFHVVCYMLTNPTENINWVFGPGSKPQRRFSPKVYLAMIIVAFPVFVYWPTHLVLVRLLPLAR